LKEFLRSSEMDRNKKILIGALGGVVALCLFMSIVGASFSMGMRMGGRNNYGYAPRAVPQAAPPAAPQDGQPPAPQIAPRSPRGNYGYYDNGSRFNRGWVFSPFGFIGGIFRLIGTLLFIGLIFFLIRMLFFRNGWGGPGRWGWNSNGRGVPPFFEEWHKRAHEPQPAPQPEATKPDESAANPSEVKPEDKPQDPQAI
jgi:hypothetical protein